MRWSVGAVSVIVMMLIAGCATQSSIDADLNQSQRKAYQNWRIQRKKAERADTTRASLHVGNKHKKGKQPLITGQLNMPSAVRLALIYNRDLQSAIEHKEYARGRVVQSLGVYTPTVKVDANYRRPEKVNSFEINGRSIQVGFKNNYSLQVDVKQPIFKFGDFAAGLKGAHLYKALTDKKIQTAAANTIYQTDQAYLNVLLLKQEYEVNKQQVALSDSMLQDARNKKKFGTASNFNLLRAKVQLSNDRTQMFRSKNNLEQAKAKLYRVMGVSQNSNVELKDTLQYKPTSVNESQAVKKALINRPDLDAQLLNVKLQHEAVVRAKGAYFPGISAFFRNVWAKPSPFIQTRDNFGRIYNVGLQLNWSLFDLSREGNIKEEKSNFRQQKINYLDERAQVLYDVHSAILGMQNASKSIKAQKLTLKQAKEGLRLAKVGYREGTQDQVSVIDARQSFAEAKLNYFQSLQNYELAHLKLLKATGQLRFHVKNKPQNVHSVDFQK